MTSNTEAGHYGEREVIDIIKCPHCKNKLMQLPKNYPVYDVQCSACMFRAQVKTNNCEPKNEILGSGWSVLEKTLKAGYLPPPLIVNFKWNACGEQRQKVLFFPFVPKSHFKPRPLKQNGKQTREIRFNYINLLSIPHFVLLDTHA
ncbi:DpnI domain-containing protein [Crenobacter caeni]|uniref:Uncharacterized protein n=1 Tax=Crenobacter caeni TaxID=2705474 RepID=A0A6B2KSS9_9NEIS|nr:DpnI domain-containing protein [Crenobacter caeni]NDV13198.1 hypothetical protein [Crenobacter caeni]